MSTVNNDVDIVEVREITRHAHDSDALSVAAHASHRSEDAIIVAAAAAYAVATRSFNASRRRLMKARLKQIVDAAQFAKAITKNASKLPGKPVQPPRTAAKNSATDQLPNERSSRLAVRTTATSVMRRAHSAAALAASGDARPNSRTIYRRLLHGNDDSTPVTPSTVQRSKSATSGVVRPSSLAVISGDDEEDPPIQIPLALQVDGAVIVQRGAALFLETLRWLRAGRRKEIALAPVATATRQRSLLAASVWRWRRATVRRMQAREIMGSIVHRWQSLCAARVGARALVNRFVVRVRAVCRFRRSWMFLRCFSTWQRCHQRRQQQRSAAALAPILDAMRADGDLKAQVFATWSQRAFLRRTEREVVAARVQERLAALFSRWCDVFRQSETRRQQRSASDTMARTVIEHAASARRRVPWVLWAEPPPHRLLAADAVCRTALLGRALRQWRRRWQAATAGSTVDKRLVAVTFRRWRGRLRELLATRTTVQRSWLRWRQRFIQRCKLGAAHTLWEVHRQRRVLVVWRDAAAAKQLRGMSLVRCAVRRWTRVAALANLVRITADVCSRPAARLRRTLRRWRTVAALTRQQRALLGDFVAGVARRIASTCFHRWKTALAPLQYQQQRSVKTITTKSRVQRSATAVPKTNSTAKLRTYSRRR
jgi:hypothetical protein